MSGEREIEEEIEAGFGCRRTESLAKQRGCTHTFATVTGNYAEKVFEGLGHSLVKVGKLRVW